MKKLIVTGCLLMSGLFFFSGCSSDDPDDCDIYCEKMTECSDALDQPFSNARCERECRDDLQAYDLVGCEDVFLDLLDCRSDISCAEANDVGSKCADEIDDLNRCLD